VIVGGVGTNVYVVPRFHHLSMTLHRDTWWAPCAALTPVACCAYWYSDGPESTQPRQQNLIAGRVPSPTGSSKSKPVL